MKLLFVSKSGRGAVGMSFGVICGRYTYANLDAIELEQNNILGTVLFLSAIFLGSFVTANVTTMVIPGETKSYRIFLIDRKITK